ncbi:MAG: hypothetical protein M1457_12850, partial [bacterium]|nr:hypothetical protein [bacterium]
MKLNQGRLGGGGYLLGAILLISAVTLGAAAPSPEGLIGHWAFDGNLSDGSGRGHDAAGESPRFGAGQAGQSLAGGELTIPSSPDFDLSPGLTVDCRLFFDRKPDQTVDLIAREGAFQLRVDSPQESGQLSFFVDLGGWEPRVVGPAIEPGIWYHVTASWTGEEIVLEVNSERYTGRRAGLAKPSKEPLTIGPAAARVDELRIYNRCVLNGRWVAAKAAAAGGRAATERFGGENGWAGWEGDRGATLAPDGAALTARFAAPGAALVQPALDVDLARRPYVLIDAVPPADCDGDLLFLTTAGYGFVPVRLYASGRTSAILMTNYPAWRGRLRLLAIVPRLTGPAVGAVTPAIRFEGIRLSERMDGKPYLYIRGLTPGRAILRVGRTEEVVCVVRNVGGPAAAARCEIAVPAGVELLDPAAHDLGALAHDATVLARWRVRAQAPVQGRAAVRAAVAGVTDARTETPLEFRAPCALPRADYVPRPQPASSPYITLMHYCPLWKLGTHIGWSKIELWPERKPAIGFYDEGTPEVADWHIKYALEHGIQGFIYCWYRGDLEPEIHERIGHAVHDGLMNARYRDMFKFTIMWENGNAKGVKNRDDMMRNLFPYWMKNFFTHPSYLKIDNKP